MSEFHSVPDHVIDRLSPVDYRDADKLDALLEVLSAHIEHERSDQPWHDENDLNPVDARIGALWRRKESYDAGSLSPRISPAPHYRGENGHNDEYVVLSIQIAMDKHGMPPKLKALVDAIREREEADYADAQEREAREALERVDAERAALLERLAELDRQAPRGKAE